jgi:hypothetical protein
MSLAFMEVDIAIGGWWVVLLKLDSCDGCVPGVAETERERWLPD